MSEIIVLGIDCGGTHTDAALLAVDEQKKTARLLGFAKTGTRHDDLPTSITECLKLIEAGEAGSNLQNVARITLGTTLEVNALVQGRADKVGLALCAGPGLDPVHFAMGSHVCIVPGGLDHRGVEVERLFTDPLAKACSEWLGQGVAAVACVGKFSPRNPAHENEMGKVAQAASHLPITLGHQLSGRLNFPRRIATAYYNAAVGRLHQEFLDAVESAFAKFGLRAKCRLLKADGGAMPFKLSRKEPVQSILSGPAASVMGVMAMWKNAATDCALLFDIGGTTTDIAIFYDGSPVVDRQGMMLEGRRTLVRSLASVSIGIGGDSLLHTEQDAERKCLIKVGPMREGPAMAFGGLRPTLMDALNTLDGGSPAGERGDIEASRKGLAELALKAGMETADCAQMAVEQALGVINRGAYELVAEINSRPIYTLAALKAIREARPKCACLVGGPAACLRERLEKSLGMPVEIAPHPGVANAIGAALTIPTATLEIYADTGRGELSAPSMGHAEHISRNYGLQDAAKRACGLLKDRLAAEGIPDAPVEVLEEALFATLDDNGRGARDIRVTCQVKPGIVAKL